MDKNDILYKIDKKTGQVWEIYGNEQLEIKETRADNLSEPSEKSVIERTKYSLSMDEVASKPYPQSNDFRIRELLEDLNGPLIVSGWQANKYDEQRYLVSYTFDEGQGESGWFFEVNTRADMVRYVNDDSVLANFYNLETPRNENVLFWFHRTFFDSTWNKSLIPMSKREKD